LLSGYFDESGTHGDAEVTVIGGYVASDADWATLETQWREALADLQLSHIHVSELRAGKAEFSKVVGIAESILKRFGKIVEKSPISPISIAIQARAWEAATTPHFRKSFPKPYDLCFSQTMRNIRAWLKRNAPDQRCALVFATQNEYEERNRATLDAWKRYGATQLGPLAFELAKCQPALQPADMLSNEVYAAWGSVTSGQARLGKMLVTDLFRQLTRNEDIPSMLMSEKAIKLFVKNEDWMDPTFACPVDPHGLLD
jgi:hypothetical protein